MAQAQLAVMTVHGSTQTWQPPSGTMYKLNFDTAVFANRAASGVGVVIRNDQGEVMAALSVKGAAMDDSEEATVLACQKALEFAEDIGFLDLISDVDHFLDTAKSSSAGSGL